MTIYTFDNAQKNYAFKFQHDGKTSNVVQVTAWLFVAMWQGPWRNFFFGNPHVVIGYVNQAIPLKFKYKSVSLNLCSNVFAIVTGDPTLQPFEVVQAFQGKQWSKFMKPDLSGQ